MMKSLFRSSAAGGSAVAAVVLCFGSVPALDAQTQTDPQTRVRAANASSSPSVPSVPPRSYVVIKTDDPDTAWRLTDDTLVVWETFYADVNRKGWAIVGWEDFVLDLNTGQMMNLNPVDGKSPRALQINDNGDVVGFSDNIGGGNQTWWRGSDPAAWSSGATGEKMALLPTSWFVNPNDTEVPSQQEGPAVVDFLCVNNSGFSVAEAIWIVNESTKIAFSGFDGAMERFPLYTDTQYYIRANNRNQFLSSEGLIDGDTLHLEVHGYGLNDDGDAVGWGAFPASLFKKSTPQSGDAWWDQYDLNDVIHADIPGPSGWVIESVADINNNGVILGSGALYANLENPTEAERSVVVMYPLEIVDKDKQPLASLKVAKMSEPGVLTGSGLDIDKDSDRFYVRIRGAAKKTSVTIKVATVDSPYSDRDYNDDESELDMYPDGPDLISKSLLLVSDDIDDGHPVDGVVDDLKNDRTHIVALGGNFRIVSVKMDDILNEVNADTSVPVQKTIHVSPIILRETADGPPVIDNSTVLERLRDARERFAQVGIALSWPPPAFTQADPPINVDVGKEGSPTIRNVDLSDGLTSGESFTEANVLLRALESSVANDIQMFFVNRLYRANGVELAGIAYNGPRTFWDSTQFHQVHHNNIFISAAHIADSLWTIPHEVGHVLTRLGHLGTDKELMDYGKDTPDLEVLINVMSERIGPDYNTIHGRKRFNKFQGEKMHEYLKSKGQ